LKTEILETEKIDSRTIRQKVYERLRHKIIYGELLPGQCVTLRDLAKQFGVSFIPVREALWQLETDKVIVIERNKSIRVNTLTAGEMTEALSIRMNLESKVAERACDLRSAEVLPRLKLLVKEMDDSVGNPTEFMVKNSEFHFTIYACADMPLHQQLISQLWTRVGPYLWIQAREPMSIQRSMPYHHAMQVALENRDKKGLSEALRHDLMSAAQHIVPHLK
jgi:DNA-binding GntR family transcriptional regulator